jgi:hypothetical protein
LKFVTDAGYEVRRPRWSRSRRSYQVTYLGNAHELAPIYDFVEREIRVGALSFVWVHPYGASVTSISNATPNLLTMAYAHGWQSGDSITISGTSSHNNTFTVTRVSATQVSLNGTAGGAAEGALGVAALRLPYASLQVEDALPVAEYEHAFGPQIDNKGLLRLSLVIQEQFA